MKVIRNDTEPTSASIGSLKTNMPHVKVTRDMDICRECEEFCVKHVYYGCKRKYVEPPPPDPLGTFTFREPPLLFDGNPTEEEMKLPENQPFFCEDYDEYKCWADAGCNNESDNKYMGYGLPGGYKKEWFEHAVVTKKCVHYEEQYISAVNRMLDKEGNKDGMA